MTEKKAEEILQELYDECCSSKCKFKGKCGKNCCVAVNTAITDMREIQQYRALGTVEDIKKKLKTELPYISIAQAKFKAELEAYKAIGSVEELRKVVEKRVLMMEEASEYLQNGLIVKEKDIL